MSLLDHIGYDSILEIAETNNLSTDEVVAVIIVYANNIAKEKIANTTIPPIVQIRPIKDEAWVGEPCIFEVYIWNPLLSGKNLTAQIVFKAPPDVVVHGMGFSTGICGTEQYVRHFNVSPGYSVDLPVSVTSLKAGEYIVSADLIWYYEGEQTPHINSLDYAVKFSPFLGAPPPRTPPPTMIPLHPLIVLIAIVVVVVVVRIVVRVLK